MNLYQAFLRPVLFGLDPEWVHDGTVRACEMMGPRRIARRVLSKDPRGLVVTLSRNTGFAHATNTGAALARGKHLLIQV